MWLFGKKIINVSSGSHVLYTASNLANSRRCQDAKEFCSLSPLFGGALVAVAVAVALRKLAIFVDVAVENL